jgi:hypothetical protein
MIIRKRVELGEYIVEIEYEDTTGDIEVTVLDALEGVIESISISDSYDDDNDNDDDDNDDLGFNDFDINLN